MDSVLFQMALLSTHFRIPAMRLRPSCFPASFPSVHVLSVVPDTAFAFPLYRTGLDFFQSSDSLQNPQYRLHRPVVFPVQAVQPFSVFVHPFPFGVFALFCRFFQVYSFSSSCMLRRIVSISCFISCTSVSGAVTLTLLP